jgi:transposase
MGSKKAGGEAVAATLRKRLVQVSACERAGESLKAYAARRGISVHSLYQAKKQARQRGLLPPHGAEKSSPARSRRPQRRRFVEAISAPATPQPGYSWRLRFSSGEVLESSTALAGDEILRLIDALRGRA